MPRPSAVGITLVLHITLCLTIRVPVNWNESEVKSNEPLVNSNENTRQNKPNLYFEYTAKKPQFAIDIAANHNVKSPENHYSSYPIRPYTGVRKPELGRHQMLNPEKESYYPYQRYVTSSDDLSHVTPSSTAYDVYHPYKAEEPALQEIYKDPILDKIRNDLKDSKNRLQQYENDAGKSDVSKEEYLESPEQTDHRYFPQKNIPSRYEIHRPMRRPVYYRPPSRFIYRENILNKKLRHPWNQNYAKVTPMHYRPIKNHLQNLRQHHALKFDDENNEYPQLPVKESYIDKPDGYDIYEKGKDNYVRLRNNIDESINKAVLQNRPITNEKLELKENHDYQDSREDDNEFVPIKNYAQVRKTETTKHLPRAAAFRDAESLDEIKNAPRLREAVKSTKAQVVYSEEGYEDSAYDHAGEQKHASDIEGHGGYLKEHELSGGKYQTPSVSAKIQDAGGSTHGEKLVHAEKWKNNNLENSDDSEVEDYSEDEQDTSEEIIIHTDNLDTEPNESSSQSSEENVNEPETENEEIPRNKREDLVSYTNNDSNNMTGYKEHIVNKREYKIPQPHTKEQSSHLNKSNENQSIILAKQKYPYYFNTNSKISNNSPLRYAENLSFIPNKTSGGTEFYDSRKEIVCPTIEEDVDPVPEKLKKGGNPDENEDTNESEEEFSQLKKSQRLEGLGDKIDCLKSKYFGADPLDSPFFSEDLIENPEPVTKPNINLFDRDKTTQIILDVQNKSNSNKALALLQNLNSYNTISNEKEKEYQSSPTSTPQNHSNSLIDQNEKTKEILSPKTLISPRTKRATPFVYEPYKIIKESQVAAESKKTTTTNNISPLIKQLQSSRVVDRVTANQNKEQITKRNTGTKSYKDIGKVDREKQRKNVSQDPQEGEFVDVSIDKRRGEPRYEIQYKNHKNHYTPVINKKSVSIDEYKGRTDAAKQSILSRSIPEETKFSHLDDIQKSAASNSVSNIIQKSTVKPATSLEEDEDGDDESEEEYDDYHDEEKNDQNKDISSTVAPTITTTNRLLRKDKQALIKTTTEPVYYEEDTTVMPILKLKTRFRSSNIASELEKGDKIVSNDNSNREKNRFLSTTTAPKLHEKKKKLSKSTVVTDTKSYGEEDDDMQKEDIDALIGVKHDTDDYLPEYEKEQNKHVKNLHDVESGEEEYDEDDSSEKDEEEEEEEDDDDDDHDHDGNDNDNDSLERGKIGLNTRHTTPEPTKRTLPKTTENIASTTELSLNDQVKPIISKKKIEVHRELPVTKLSPNATHFRQDIKEVEIIKSITPKRRQKPQKNLEALDLYKDENLAKDVNKLGGVEIFRPDLNIGTGPRHGGNYRSIESKHRSTTPSKPDIASSRSQTTNLAEQKDSKNISRPLSAKRGGVLRNNKRYSEAENISEAANPSRQSHGGNLKTSPRRSRLPNNKSEKIIELSDNKAPLQLHGGNLKMRRVSNNEGNIEKEKDNSSEIIEDPDEVNKNKSKRKAKNDTDSAAILLETYARAVPMLTTAPPFILDPSKRRYYYVDV